MASFILIRT